MINRIVLGKSAKKFRDENNIEKGQSIRPYLTKEQINQLEAMQKVDKCPSGAFFVLTIEIHRFIIMTLGSPPILYLPCLGSAWQPSHSVVGDFFIAKKA